MLKYEPYFWTGYVMKDKLWQVTGKALALCLLTIQFSGAVYAQYDFSYSDDSNTVVVRYSRTPGEIEAPDSSTTATIYGNGRVIVHYPPYGTRKGDYQTNLSAAELDALISNLLDKDVMAYDAQDVANQKQEIMQDENIGFYIGDADISIIEIKLASYNPQGLPNRYDVREKISVSALQAQAQRFPSIHSLVNLAAAERQFLDLISSDNLSPLR
jgi:hypothetical protein